MVSRGGKDYCSASTSHIPFTTTTAAPQGNEIRASEDPRAILSPSPAQIRHDYAKFNQPAPRPPNLKHARLDSTDVSQTSPSQNLVALASE